MKYFTPELWASWQTRQIEPPRPEQDPFVLYRRELELLRDRVSPAAYHFFADADVHDSELLEFQVVDGSRPAPVGEPGRAWVQQGGFPVAVSMRLLDGLDELVWSLRYRQVRRVVVDYPAVPLFHHEGHGFGDWGYDELSDAGDGFLRHEVLFASGATILIEFQVVEVASERARPAAEQPASADERAND